MHHGRRNTAGVPEWNEAEINTVLELWNQHNRLPQWKPIANKLAELNAHGELNSELASKGIERTNNAVMNKVKELSGMSRARRSRPRTLGNFASLEPENIAQVGSGGGTLPPPHPDVPAPAMPDDGAARALAVTTAVTSSLAGAPSSPAGRGEYSFNGPVAGTRLRVLAAPSAALPALERTPEVSIPPPPAGLADSTSPVAASIALHSPGGWGNALDMPPALQSPSATRKHTCMQAMRSAVPVVSPVVHKTPVIAQAKLIELSYADGTGPAVPQVGPCAHQPVLPVVQNDP
jgi:hypothetical protein